MMKPRYIVGSIVAIGCVVLSFWLLSSTGVQYASIATAQELLTRVSIKGHWMRDRETTYDSQNNTFRFVMKDDSNATVTVIYHGSKPNNFELAESVVVKGTMKGSVFHATDILTKCPSKYEGSDQIEKVRKTTTQTM